MIYKSLLVFLTLCSFAVAADFQCTSDSDPVPQAQPVLQWLEAAKNGDLELLKTVFAERVRKQFAGEGWDNVMKTYQRVFQKEFGDYTLDDFAFEFEGGEEHGTVSIVFKEKKLPGKLRVVKEKDSWKVNER